MSEVDLESSQSEAPAPLEGEPTNVTTDVEKPAELSPMEELEAERDRLKSQLLRTAADFDNFRKRSRKDIEQAERRGRETVLREMLNVIDNLERAVEAADKAADVAAVRDGVKMVLKLFDDTASRIGLQPLKAVGERFDPNIHDAFQQQETDEFPPGTVVAEFQRGYLLGDKLLRPAMVVVARKPTATAEHSVPAPAPAADGSEEEEEIEEIEEIEAEEISDEGAEEVTDGQSEEEDTKA